MGKTKSAKNQSEGESYPPKTQLEIRADIDYVSIPIDRFEELIRAEERVRMLEVAHKKSTYGIGNSIDISAVLDCTCQKDDG